MGQRWQQSKGEQRGEQDVAGDHGAQRWNPHEAVGRIVHIALLVGVDDDLLSVDGERHAGQLLRSDEMIRD
jgi:hypothetical protein